MLAPARADDDMQVPNVLNAPRAAAVIAYDQPVIAIVHVRVVDGTGAAAGIVGTHNHLYFVSGGPLFIVREMPFSFSRLYLAAGVGSARLLASVRGKVGRQ